MLFKLNIRCRLVVALIVENGIKIVISDVIIKDLSSFAEPTEDFMSNLLDVVYLNSWYT